MSAPRCGCPDPGVGAEQHCLLLQDFPGGLYDDMDASRDEICDCRCHAYDESLEAGESNE